MPGDVLGAKHKMLKRSSMCDGQHHTNERISACDKLKVGWRRQWANDKETNWVGEI